MYPKIVDMNDILRKSDVDSSRQDQTQLDSTSEGKENEAITGDAERHLFHVQFKRSYWWAVIGDFQFVFFVAQKPSPDE